jgi:phospholipase C
MRTSLGDVSGGLIAGLPEGSLTDPAQPGDILTDLFHGDQLVQSTFGLILQATPSEGDSTWRLRLQLAPGSPAGETYKYEIEVQYPSILPILTRRIPLGFFNQGFHDNWNGRNYVYVNINANKAVVQFDQELASYYGLKEAVVELGLPYISVDNVRTSDISLDAGAADSPFPWLQGHLPFFQLTVSFTRDNSSSPITLNLPVGSISLPDFAFTFKFFLTAFGQLTYVTKFESPLLDQVPTSFRDPLSLEEINPRQMIEDAVERKLDTYGYVVGAVLRTWFLGADFDVSDVRHDPATNEIVVDYVGQESIQTDPVFTIDPGGPPSPPIADPPLITDPLYAPRGAGDSSWKPRSHNVGLPGDGLPGPLGPATTPGDLSKVDHIVVVMMENRSFDHMLGFLSRDNGRSDIEGLKAETGDNRTQFNYYNGRFYYPEKLTDTRILESPHHHHEATKGQMADGMMHFVSDYARLVGEDPARLRNVMGYYGGDQLHAYATLAENYIVCDHWFASHVGPTIPNRFVLLTGDLNRDTWGEPEVDTPDYTTFTPSEADTLFDHLSARGVSWRYFQHRASMMRVFTKYTFDMTNVVEFDDPDRGFQATARRGELPSVTFVDPAFGDLPAGVGQPPDNDDAPPADLLDGQTFISTVVQTLLDPNQNRLWEKTMLIIVYDEHGGFYDHVDPPNDRVPLLGQNSGKLGPRVPAFVVSPWTPRRTVLKDVFEHASIPATILRRFCSPHPPPMGPRVAAARDLRGALSLTRARGDLVATLPAVPSGMAMARMAAIERRFRAPKNSDDFGAFLGGALMTTGAAPRSTS